MSYQADSEYHRGFEIKIFQDEDAANPLEDWDGWANFRCYHNDYSLSNTKEFEDSEDLIEFLKNDKKIVRTVLLEKTTENNEN